MTLLLSDRDVDELVSMPAAMDAMARAFEYLERGQTRMPQRVATEVPGAGTHLSMPCFAGSDPGELSLKVVTVFPGNKDRGQSTTKAMLLYQDARSGECLAIMSAERLTALRTGAASGLATRYLARRDADRVALFGAGGQALDQLRAMSAVRAIRSVSVVSRSSERREQFCARARRTLGIEVEEELDPERALDRARIVCTATSSSVPVFDGSLLEPGTHVNAIGAFRADMAEVDPAGVARATVYVDHVAAARAGAGDLIQASQAGRFAFDSIAGTLGKLVLDRCAGRVDGDQITLFKSVGVAVQDTVIAGVAYRNARERGAGQTIELD